MKKEQIFKGIIPPMPTIFTEEGKLDIGGMGRLIDHVIQGGVHGLFFLGSGGEFSNMTETLRKEVAKFCVKYTAGRVPVLIGIGAPGTDETIMYGKHAQSIGADGVVVINPYYGSIGEENLYNHYKQISKELDLPILVYNYPGVSGQNFPVHILKRVALECPNIIGLKDTVDTMNHIRSVILEIKSVRPDFLVFSGFDEYLLSTLIMGGDGSVPASAVFAPHLTVGIYEAFLKKDYESAFKLQRLLSYVPEEIYPLESPFYAVIKESARMVGVDISTHVLAPAAALSKEKKELLKVSLKKLLLLNK
ncbi:MAG TPA: dihydrodipicolinate synthase family protein [Clostridium sp.]|uniref:dihydrodipicolinate synthase family protein n=1 Tax=Clostridium sp. TaxID=1506 RepID=UPI002F92A782